MLKEGLFEQLRPDVVFGLHAAAEEGGVIFAASGGAMASSNSWRMFIRGRQTHGAFPHQGVDPITATAQIIQALQLIPARQINADQRRQHSWRRSFEHYPGAGRAVGHAARA
jgi:amidohydrolase